METPVRTSPAPPSAPFVAPAASGMPEAGPDMDPLLATWLRAGPSACPRCGYDVSAAVRAVCPECGAGLRLQVTPVDTATVLYCTILAVLALVPGFTLLFVIGATVHHAIHRSVLQQGEQLRPTLVLGLLAAIPLAAWILGRRRFLRLGPTGRRVAAGTGCLIGSLFIIAVVRA